MSWRRSVSSATMVCRALRSVSASKALSASGSSAIGACSRSDGGAYRSLSAVWLGVSSSAREAGSGAGARASDERGSCSANKSWVVLSPESESSGSSVVAAKSADESLRGACAGGSDAASSAGGAAADAPPAGAASAGGAYGSCKSVGGGHVLDATGSSLDGAALGSAWMGPVWGASDATCSASSADASTDGASGRGTPFGSSPVRSCSASGCGGAGAAWSGGSRSESQSFGGAYGSWSLGPNKSSSSNVYALFGACEASGGGAKSDAACASFAHASGSASLSVWGGCTSDATSEDTGGGAGANGSAVALGSVGSWLGADGVGPNKSSVSPYDVVLDTCR